MQGDLSADGNAPFGYAAGAIVPIVATDLNVYWPQLLAGESISLPQLTVVPVQSADQVDCADPAGDFATGAVYCAVTSEVFLDEVLARDLYTRFGDFAVGYMLGGAWSEAVQAALDSPLSGEDRALVDDCLTGAWVGTIIPDATGQTDRDARIEPGDLDEAIQTALGRGRPDIDGRRAGERLREDRQLPPGCARGHRRLHRSYRRLTPSPGRRLGLG